jgi:hypothetical protein
MCYGLQCAVVCCMHQLPTSVLLLLMSLSTCSLLSGTVTMPVLGSMVQKGKLAAAALPFSTMALNSVDCVAAECMAERGAGVAIGQANTACCRVAGHRQALAPWPACHNIVAPLMMWWSWTHAAHLANVWQTNDASLKSVQDGSPVHVKHQCQRLILYDPGDRDATETTQEILQIKQLQLQPEAPDGVWSSRESPRLSGTRPWCSHIDASEWLAAPESASAAGEGPAEAMQLCRLHLDNLMQWSYSKPASSVLRSNGCL